MNPIIVPKAVNGWVAHSFNLGTSSYDLDSIYSPSNVFSESHVLKLPSPKFEGDPAYIFDTSGYGNHGTLAGPTWSRTNKGLPVLTFAGFDDQITFGNPTSLQGLTTFTYSVWAYWTTLATAESYHGLGVKGDGATVGWRLLILPTGEIILYTNNVNLQSAAGKIIINKWQNIIIGHDGTKGHIYYQGALAVATATKAYTPADATNFLIGDRGDGYGSFNGFLGFPIRWTSQPPSLALAQQIFNEERHLYNV